MGALVETKFGVGNIGTLGQFHASLFCFSLLFQFFIAQLIVQGFFLSISHIDEYADNAAIAQRILSLTVRYVQNDFSPRR